MEQRGSLNRIMRRIEQIPTLPVVTKRILEIGEDDPRAFQKYTELIKADQALALKVLKLANSALYGGLGRVSTLDSAMVRLGTREVQTAVLAFTVQGFFSTEAGGVFDRKRFWKHALVTSQAAKLLSLTYRVQPDEWVFLIGLIHDVGKAFTDAYLHEDFLRVVDILHSRHTTFSRAEKVVLGTTHYQIGAKLLKKWRFPPEVFLPVLYHHAPWYEHEHQDATILLYLANILSKLAGYPSHVDEKALDPAEFASSPEARFVIKSGFDLDLDTLQRLTAKLRDLIREEAANMMAIFD